MTHNFSIKNIPSAALYFLLPLLAGFALLSIPLLRDFHVDSAMFAGLIGAFWATIQGAGSSPNNRKKHFYILTRILGSLYLAALPLLLFSLWNKCFTGAGLGFWILIPAPSTIFGLALGRLCSSIRLPKPVIWAVGLCSLIAFGLPFIELMQFPQVYFFNHIWGTWPGPVYDEAVQLTSSFYYFRWITLLWIILFWVMPNWRQSHTRIVLTLLTVAALGVSYVNLDKAGIISPNKTIKQELGGNHKAGPITLFYDKDAFTEEEVVFWAARHRFHFQQIKQELDISWPANRTIESYLYADAWQKKTLTGAKFTSYVPVWLHQDQMHIAKQQLPDVLKHEMVHVLAKQFGNRIFRASWSMGLTEGLAEAITINRNRSSTLHQIVAAQKPWPDAHQMRSAFSWSGFYGSAGAISYTTTGSFTRFLLQNYPVKYLKKAYHSGNIRQAYQKSWSLLVDEWHDVLRQTPVDDAARQTSAYIFARQSLFEKTCPRSVKQNQKLWDEYRHRLIQKDSVRAYHALQQLYEIEPGNALVKDHWARLSISRNCASKAKNAITPKDTSLHLQLWKADALFVTNGYEAAKKHLDTYQQAITHSGEANLRFSLNLREDSLQWQLHIQRQYFNQLPDSAVYTQMNVPNKVLTAAKALTLEHEFPVIPYAHILSRQAIATPLFPHYEALAERLIFWGEFELAQTYLQLLEQKPLRLQHQERLQELHDWYHFMQNKSTFAD